MKAGPEHRHQSGRRHRRRPSFEFLLLWTPGLRPVAEVFGNYQASAPETQPDRVDHTTLSGFCACFPVTVGRLDGGIGALHKNLGGIIVHLHRIPRVTALYDFAVVGTEMEPATVEIGDGHLPTIVLFVRQLFRGVDDLVPGTGTRRR